MLLPGECRSPRRFPTLAALATFNTFTVSWHERCKVLPVEADLETSQGLGASLAI